MQKQCCQNKRFYKDDKEFGNGLDFSLLRANSMSSLNYASLALPLNQYETESISRAMNGAIHGVLVAI